MEEGAGNPANANENQARLISEILAEFIAELGIDRAMTPDAVVIIEGGAVGPLPRSGATQSICEIPKRHPVIKAVRSLPMGSARLTGRGSVGVLLPTGPYACLDAKSGGDALGAVLSHRNFVCPRAHCQARAGEALTLSAKSPSDTSFPLSSAIS